MERCLDVSSLLTTLTQEEGVALYGKNFYNTDTIAKLHFWNAAQRDSDHIHEGAGFLSQHLKLTNMFDASIQSVDPSVTLPYWDFTIDSVVTPDGKLFSSFISSPD